jgi:hypothetical protein
MRTDVEAILNAVVWIVNHTDDANLKETPVLELAKTLAASNTGPHEFRIFLQELPTLRRQKNVALSHKEKNAA